jgi:hypothetical protein
MGMGSAPRIFQFATPIFELKTESENANGNGNRNGKKVGAIEKSAPLQERFP